MKAWEWAVWIALCLVPLAVAAASLGSLPDTVAMHVGPDGTIDRYGSKYELLPIACLLALPNLLLMLASWKAEALFAKGLVHGIDSPRNLRTLFLVLGMVDTVIYLGIMLSFGRGVLAGYIGRRCPSSQVSTTGPSSVMATVFSKWAEGRPSRVHTSQPSGIWRVL